MIRRQRGRIMTDDSGRELWEYREQGDPSFPFVANECDLTWIPPHWHSEIELYLQTSGTAKVIADGEVFLLNRGEGCFINTGVIHEMLPIGEETSSYHSFVFDAGIIGGAVDSVFARDYIHPLLEHGPHCHVFHESELWPEALNRAFDAADHEPGGWQFTVRNEFSRLLLSIEIPVREEAVQSDENLHSTRARQMLSFIDNRFRDAITLDNIASAASISRRECQRVFNDILHRSPIEYLNERRLSAGEQLLSDTDMNVTEIALACGFSGSSYFTEQFRRKFGMTPSAYRKIRR